MATDYSQPSAVEKRVRFFDGQFLQDQDFVDEQKYHLDRERRHNRLLHLTGVAEGLAVASGGANKVSVAPGTAIDGDGRQLVLAQPATVDLPAEKFNDKQGIELYLTYEESAQDRQTEEGSADYTRWLERPQFVVIGPGDTYQGATPPVLLARLALDNAGRVTVDDSARLYSGLRLPGPRADAPSLRTAAGGRVALVGSLTVDGQVGIGTTSIKHELTVNGRVYVESGVIQRGGNPITRTTDLGLYSQVEGNYIRLVTRNAPIRLYTDGDVGTAPRLSVNQDGNVAVGTSGSAVARLDIQQAARTGAHPAAVKGLYVTGDFGEAADGVEFRHSNATQGIGFGFNSIYATGTNATQHLNLMPKGTGGVGIGTTTPGAKLDVRAENTTAGGWYEAIRLSRAEHSAITHPGGGLLFGLNSDRNFYFGDIKDGALQKYVVQIEADTGNVGIGTTTPAARLTVSAAGSHLQLRRETTGTTGGRQIFLELYQEDTRPTPTVPEVWPSIRFHHNNRFWHRMEGQSSGFHFKTGLLTGDDYVDVRARTFYGAGLQISAGKIQLDGNQQIAFADADVSNNLKLQLWTGYGLGINPSTLFYAANGRHSWRDNGGANERMALSTGADGALTVNGTGTSSFAGKLGIGITSSWSKLTVSAAGDHLQLRREATETTGGSKVFLELYQDDTRPNPSIPEVWPSIRFHHNNRFWHRIEGQVSGFHFKAGGSEDYVDIKARDFYSTGQIYFHPGYEWGQEGQFGPDQKRYWYVFRPRWNYNNFGGGGAELRATGIPFPSDVRLKDGIEDIQGALEKVSRLRGVGFWWNERGLRHLTSDVETSVSAGPDATDEENESVWQEIREQRHAQLAHRNVGLVAQEVEQVVPEVVLTDEHGYKYIDYGKVTAVLVEAVKEQQSTIQSLSARVTALEGATAA